MDYGMFGTKSRGDIIEVRMMTNSFQVYFRLQADMENKKKMRELASILKSKGVEL